MAENKLADTSTKFAITMFAKQVVLFQLNPPLRVGEIIFDDEIPCGDEIRLDGGRVDLISSAKQISSELRSDFIAQQRDFID